MKSQYAISLKSAPKDVRWRQRGEKHMTSFSERLQAAKNWALQERHQQQARKMGTGLLRLFTEHPAQTGETFFEHLKFTTIMSLRIILCGTILLIHGYFPFT